eukprot:84882-Prymnesium_polylepis.1
MSAEPAVGVAVPVAQGTNDEEVRAFLRPNEESSSWLTTKLKESFELSDEEAERATAMVMGRPNFLKTTRMLRTRRRRNPEQWEKLTKRVAAAFSEACDVDATAATVEALMSEWLDDKVPSPDAAEIAATAEPAAAEPPDEPQPAEPPDEPQPAEPPAEAPAQAVQYSEEGRSQRIAELEEFWQGKHGHLHGGHWKAVFVPSKSLRARDKKHVRLCRRKSTHVGLGGAVGPHMRITTMEFERRRSFDSVCCAKGQRFFKEARPYIAVKLSKGTKVSVNLRLFREAQGSVCSCVHNPTACGGGWTQHAASVAGRANVLARCSCRESDADVQLRDKSSEEEENLRGWEDDKVPEMDTMESQEHEDP